MDLIRLGDRRNVVQYAKNCRLRPCVSCIVVDLGTKPSVGIFPSYMLKTVSGKI